MKGSPVLLPRGHTPSCTGGRKGHLGLQVPQKRSQQWVGSRYGCLQVRGHLDRREPTLRQAAPHSQSAACLRSSFSLFLHLGPDPLGLRSEPSIVTPAPQHYSNWGWLI